MHAMAFQKEISTGALMVKSAGMFAGKQHFFRLLPLIALLLVAAAPRVDGAADVYADSGRVLALDHQNCRAKRSSEIVTVFDKGIALNEAFKRSVGGPDKGRYRRLRQELEQFDEQ